MKLLQVDFAFSGPFGNDMANTLKDLAQSINQEPGMVWKIWTENAEMGIGGGVYLFQDETTAQSYLTMHTVRLKQLGVEEVRGIIFDINTPLTAINHGPVTPV